MNEDLPTAPIAPDPGDRGAPHSQQASLPDRIGKYHVLGVLGEGGFGVVYEAEQTEPVKRRVAVKVIKAGMDSASVISRFEAERQALAVMDHPCVAKIFDGGLTEPEHGGRPYFAMELVRGEPITNYCDKNRLSIEARVALFKQVCEAVQHAHSKGVIHRDLKPSNILVGHSEQGPAPKVIDFGVAKAISQRLSEATIFTQQGQLVGTPEYMSPEQAEMSGTDIDTRSDIYSLGVVLYELLMGRRPFESAQLRQAGLAEIQRIIREDDPPRPSTRLSTVISSDADLASRMAKARQTEPRQLEKRLRGELDWVVMKCLAKERDRRYESANGLAAELGRFLDGDVVQARPPSRVYKARKFARRNKAGVVAASLVMFTLAGATGVSIVFAAQARASERVAKGQTKLAELETARAERELARATEIKTLITDMLSSVNPAEAQGADIELMKGILDNTAERLTSGEITDELVAAELHAVIGIVYMDLGLYQDAERHLPRAVEIRIRVLGEEHLDTLDSISSLATLYNHQARYTEAEPLYQKTLEIRIRVLGEEHPSTLSSMNNLATLYHHQARYTEAEPLYLQTLKIRTRVLGAEHPSTLDSMTNLAALYNRQGRHSEAEPLFLQTLEIQSRVLGEDHPNTLLTMGNLAILYKVQGRNAEAEPLILKTLEMRTRVLGEEHPSTLDSMGNLAIFYKVQGRNAEAEPLYLKKLEIQRRVLGEEHQSTLSSVNSLADFLIQTSKPEGARWLLEENLPAARRVLATADPLTLGLYLATLGESQIALELFGPAERSLLESHAILVSIGNTGWAEAIAGMIADHYIARHEAEPGAGHDAQAAEWAERLDGSSRGDAGDEATADEAVPAGAGG
ncbi:MAG: serine/threonine protein kinase/tetratricopeptide (TPR) repeat protein [Phycisphaerales bacterium]|jgi:serine/threonine protein kinase/tetratricopeptide (TPR) repeat protein